MTDETIPTLIAREIRPRYEKMGEGHLKIYASYVGGQKRSEAFTFQSLADVLNLPMGTLEGRYNRGRLYRWMVPIPTGESRPVRGFPYELLADVIRIIETPGARVHAEEGKEYVVDRGGRRPMQRGPLATETIAGKRYITVPAMAEHFGMSITTVRNKLSTSGLSRFAVAIRSQLQAGGRPRKVYPASMEDKLRMALESGATFHSELDEILARARATEPPPFDPSTVLRFQRPAKPRLELVKPEPAKEDVGDLMASINGLLAQAKKPEPLHKPGERQVVGYVALEDADPATLERHRHQTPSPQDPHADVREGLLAMLRMEGFSGEAMREGEAMLRDQQLPDDVVGAIMAQARAEADQRAGGAA